ncbi:T9SS type A sorting domain-containing protein [Chryseobacterium sp. Ch-15]|uniref:T9SS type A sorting domain-containing protein n=1 Tax=Chryseobacterium muglaense TaxID=2893752 RepID=A0A9Q3US22_9FLAO|nr:T9SS type A sorting domain-containing protein [Chryseobacterium muglaense]MBD3903440.1 T9SS type A sorting domain-containing protein [Chryseobacterium muglaense]MCC9034513.1 T9SS type A sorting domain-containing protein [Chryseobacterium muglaense]MCM2552775.1 T9SS type A sorting domain-containing protein [Chryseobacterium muglaense]
MKKTLLILISTTGFLSAQTTITKTFNDPTIGETVNNVNITGTVDNSATGNNVTFNNATLTAGTASSATYSAPTSSEISTFPGSTIKMTGGGSTAYYKQTATKLEITGLVTPDATLNFSTNNGTFIGYPASFGYSENDTASGTFSATAGSGNFSGTIAISADAAGTLLIGTKTYLNVLRIKSIQNFNLTVFGFPVGTVVNTTYAYYDNLHKAPLLSTTNAVITVQGTPQNTNIAQALNETFLAVSDLKLKEKLSIYPNPAQDFIQLKGNTSKDSKIKIYSLDGKLVKTTDLRSEKIEISELPPSSYFIEVSDSKTAKETTKFIKK